MFDYNLSAEQKESARRNVELAKHYPRVVATTANDESFGKKIARAVKARQASRHHVATTQKQHAEQAEKERSRYRKLTRRERCKGE